MVVRRRFGRHVDRPVGPLPVSVHAACTAAPEATYSPGAGTTTGAAKTCAATAATAGFCAAPPISSSRSATHARAARRRGRRRAPQSMPLDRRAREVRARRRVDGHAVTASRWRPAGWACARPRSTARARGRRRPAGACSASAAELVVVDAEQAGGGVEDAGGVQRRDQRQELAGCVGEAGDRAGGVGVGARRSTANTVPEVPIETTTSPAAAPSPSAAPALSPAPGADHDAGGDARQPLDRAAAAGLARGAEHARQHRVVAPERDLEQHRSYAPARRIEVAGAGGVRPVRRQGLEHRARAGARRRGRSRAAARSASRGGARRPRRARRCPARRHAASAAWWP